MKCTNTVGKTALAVLLDRVATNIQFAKKKKEKKSTIKQTTIKQGMPVLCTGCYEG